MTEQNAQSAESQKDNSDAKDKARWKTLRLIQGYVLILVGLFLVIYSLIPPVHPAALTLGGAMIGFNPMIRAASDS